MSYEFEPDDRSVEYPELSEDPHGGLYLIILTLLCLIFWAGLFKSQGWI